MISPTADSLLIAFVLAAALEWSVRRSSLLRRTGFGSLSIALILAAAVSAALSPSYHADPIAGRLPSQILYYVAAGAFAVHAAGLRSAMAGRSSARRHLIGTLLAGVAAYIGGLTVTSLPFPGPGVLELGGIGGFFVTILWVFLIVAIIEASSLLPFAAGLAAILVAFGVQIIDSAWTNLPGFVLSGALIGGVFGRALPDLFPGKSRPMDPAETLTLGYFTACATLAVYIKNYALAVAVFPVLFVAILGVIILTQSLNQSLMLRGGPRG